MQNHGPFVFGENMKLKREFYLNDTFSVAKDLLGKILYRKIDDIVLSGMITEVEAYCGISDRACHAYGNRKTKRTEIMYNIGGFSYVYFIYGMYYCFNVVTRDINIPEAVLIRSIEPIKGIEVMSLNRYKMEYSKLKKSQKSNLTNGPGKVCRALNIDKSHSGIDLTLNEIWIEDDGFYDFKVEYSKRIGIENYGEAKDYLWRMILKNPVSEHSLSK